MIIYRKNGCLFTYTKIKEHNKKFFSLQKSVHALLIGYLKKELQQFDVGKEMQQFHVGKEMFLVGLDLTTWKEKLQLNKLEMIIL